PPFMDQGYEGEAKIIAAWEDKFKTPIMSVAQNHVRSLKALKAKSFVVATYFPDRLNSIFAKLFHAAGLEVRGMAGLDGTFNKVQEPSGEQVYAYVKRNFIKCKGADAIYLLGPGWRPLPFSQTLEQDLQVPVGHPVPARIWEFRKRLSVREPR